jgi:hypothetical protein
MAWRLGSQEAWRLMESGLLASQLYSFPAQNHICDIFHIDTVFPLDLPNLALSTHMLQIAD